ncbi:AI-2E family transporter [Mobiluncus curtisii]|uniref:AI-2E family transporter n=1 Tax=Mobiluncus curtisii TaxID=2051 RepID=UPI002015F774|nr:AI-2E family transporter [Mobiluncus curtisii]
MTTTNRNGSAMEKKALLNAGAEYRRGWWREVIARRDTQNRVPNFDELEPTAPPLVENGPNSAYAVSWRIRVAASWAWRFLAIVAALGLILYGITKVSIVFIPLAIALLLTLLLEPMHLRLQKWHIPKTLSAIISLLVGVGLVVAMIWIATSQLAHGAPALLVKAGGGFDKALAWLSDGPLKLDQEQIEKYIHELTAQITAFATKYSSSIASSALSVTSSVASVVTTILISLFCLFFFLKDGRQIWIWLIRMLPVPAREPVHEAAIRGWTTLNGYIRAQAVVALVDSVFISIGAAVLGAGSMTIPLALLIFIGAFIPIVGAVTTGAIAVLILLLDKGFMAAVIMLIVILAVQQIESNVLHPMLMSSAVNLHPLAVLLGVTAGTFLAGIIGALLVVPVIAFFNTVVLYLTGHDSMPELSTRHDRIGGAPGTVHAQVAASYIGGSKKDTAKVMATQELSRQQSTAATASPAKDPTEKAGDTAVADGPATDSATSAGSEKS